MTRYIMTYQIEIEATSHEDAALKGIEFLSNDLTDPYTELSVTTETLLNTPTLQLPYIVREEHIVGISKDPRGHRSYKLITDEDIGDNHK